MNWRRLRREIYERDGGRCQVCLTRVKQWDAGHLIDRIVDGQDTLENVVVMCRRCNLSKPITPTRGEALGWMVRQRMQTPIDWQSTWDLLRGEDGTAWRARDG